MQYKRFVLLFCLGILFPLFLSCQKYRCESVAAQGFGSSKQAIINGTIVYGVPSYANVVLLYYKNDYYCTGVLVTNEWVLTAAHCINDGDTDEANYSIYFGPELEPIFNLEPLCPSTQFSKVDRILRHPDRITDIALFHTKTSFVINQKASGYKLDIYDGPTKDLYEKTFIQFGYGRSQEDTLSDGYLRKEQVIAKQFGSPFLYLPKNELDQTIGPGDSGGPLFFPDTYSLAAIGSAKFLDAADDGAGLAVPSSMFRDWVLSQI